MKTIIFVDKNTIDFFKKDVLPILEKEHLLILTDSRTIKEELEFLNLNVIYVSDSSGDDNRKSAIDFLNNLQARKISDKDLLALFDCEGISIWHMLPSYFYSALHKIIISFNLIKKIIEHYQPTEIIIISCPRSYKIIGSLEDKLLLQKIIKLLGEKHDIKVKEFEFNPYTLKERIIFANLPFAIFVILLCFIFKMLKRKTIDKFYRLILNRSSKHNNKKQKILFVSANIYWRRGYNFFNNKFENIDTINYPIIYKLKDEFDVLGIEPQYLDKNNSALKEKLRQSFTTWKSFEGYFTFSVLRNSLKKYFNFLDKLSKYFREIKNEFLIYDSVNLYSLFKPEINSNMKNIFYCLLFIEIAKKIIKKEKPLCCFLTYETGPYERAIIYNCQKKGIPTIGLQHGVGSYDTNPDYIRNYSYNPEQALLPTYMFVYGEETQQTFQEGGYLSERIRVMGNQEYDFCRILREKKEQVKRDLIERCNIPKNKKIVLFISTSPYEEITKADINYHLEKVYGYFGGLQDYFLIIKLHHGERGLIDHKTILESKGVKGRYWITANDACISELLLLSEFAIMYDSTAGYEAIVWRVPLISINFTNYNVSIGCVRQGLVPTAKEVKDLDYFLKHYPKTIPSEQELMKFIKSNIANYPEFRAADKIAEFVKLTVLNKP